MITQSVGVPRTAKCRSLTSRNRSGSFSDSECDTPDWSSSGATTHTSSDNAAAICSTICKPGACMPSSLVHRIRIVLRAFLFNHLGAAHIRLQCIGNGDRAVGLLIVLDHRDQRAADRCARAVQRVHEARLAVAAAVARIHAPGLKIAAHRARRYLAIGAAALAWHPHF